MDGPYKERGEKMTVEEMKKRLINLGEQGREKLLDDVSAEASQAFEEETLTYRAFCSGWIGGAIEDWFHRQETREKVDRAFKIKSGQVPMQGASSRPVNSSGGDGFVSEAGRDAFERNVRNIRIKGQPVNPSESSPQWQEEGFLSEQAAIAFKKAKANNQIRILNERR